MRYAKPIEGLKRAGHRPPRANCTYTPPPPYRVSSISNLEKAVVDPGARRASMNLRDIDSTGWTVIAIATVVLLLLVLPIVL